MVVLVSKGGKYSQIYLHSNNGLVLCNTKPSVDKELTTFLPLFTINSAKSVFPSSLCWLEKANSSVRFRRPLLKIISETSYALKRFRFFSICFRLDYRRHFVLERCQCPLLQTAFCKLV